MPGSEIADRLLILAVQIFGDENFHGDVLIAFLAAALDTSALDAEFGAAAGSRRNRQLHRTIERGYIHFCSKQSVINRNRQINIDIKLFPPKIIVRQNSGDNIQVARPAAGLLSAPFEANPASIVHPGGNFDLNSFPHTVPINLQRQIGTPHRLHKRQRHLMFDIGPALRRRRRRLRATPTAPFGLSGGGASEELLKNVRKLSRSTADVKILDTHVGTGMPLVAAGPRPPTGRLRPAERIAGIHSDPGMTKLIIIGPFGRIRKHVVSFLHFLEFLLRLFVIFIHVRVILSDQFAVRLLDLIGRRAFRQAQNFIVITFSHFFDPVPAYIRSFFHSKALCALRLAVIGRSAELTLPGRWAMNIRRMKGKTNKSLRATRSLRLRRFLSQTRRQYGRTAFTLVELVLCMAILAIFAAIAEPRYMRSISHYHADVAARRLAADLDWARALAKSTSADQVISFDLTHSTYTLAGVADPDNQSQTYSVNLAGSPYQSTLSSASFGGAATLTFDGFGTPSSSGSATITCGDATKTVTVNADTGAVSVQ